MAEQRPPERTSQREEREFYHQLHKEPGNGGTGGTRGGLDPRRHTDSPPSRRYRLIVAVVAIAFVAIAIYLIVVGITGA